MLISRPALRTLTAAALGLSTLGLTLGTATPSSAGETVTTVTTAQPSRTDVVFGGRIDIEVNVDSPSGSAPTQGSSALLAQPAGATTWTRVATNDSPSGDFSGVKPRRNTTYKVVYSGASPSSSASGDTYTSSESAPFAVSVARRITYPTSGFVLSGSVTPKYRNKVITIRASQSRTSGFTRFRKIRTDRAGRYRTTLPRRDGTWFWKVSVKGDTAFQGNSYVWETQVFY